MARYHAPKLAPQEGAVIMETLESIAREGARAMLARMLDEEVDEFLGRPRYAKGGRSTGYRNGHGREREVGIGTWSVAVRQPRVSDLPAGSEPFASTILPKRRYLSAETQRLFARLYLEGLSSGDFEPAFRGLMGADATLSPSTIIRLEDRVAGRVRDLPQPDHHVPLRLHLVGRRVPRCRPGEGAQLPARGHRCP